MKNLLNCKVVMLPTEKATRITKYQICRNKTGEEDRLSLHDRDTCYSGSVNQHLYLISDREIKEGDYIILIDRIEKIISIEGINIKHTSVNEKRGFSYSLINHCLKIEATTDNLKYLQNHSLKDNREDFNTVESIPNIPQSFIEAYIKSKGTIKEVQIEIDIDEINELSSGNTPSEYLVKTREDNTVIIHQSKTYTREEVTTLCRMAHARGLDSGENFNIEEWITNNL